MKFLTVLAVMGILAGFQASADTKETWDCDNIEKPGLGGVFIVTDSSNYTPGSGFKSIVLARLGYQYSSINQMVCEGIIENDSFDVDCVGLYANREPMVMKVRNENGKVVAHWRTMKVYGHREMTSICVKK